MNRADRDVHVGIDFGGTKVFGALVGGGGVISDETYVEHGGTAIPADFSPAEAALGTGYARLHDLAAALIARARASGRNPVGVGIGAPGMIGPGGLVLVAGAIGWKNAPLGPMLERRLGLPVRIENDVNLAALGEHMSGAGRGKNSLFLIAIGTGIGGGCIIDGKLWRGGRFAAAEIGALLPGPEFLGWSDRDWGAFEAYASGTGLHNQARAAAQAVAGGAAVAAEDLRGERLFAAAAAGVPWAHQVVDHAVKLWTVAIGAVQALIDPEVVVLSGGVAPSVTPFLPEIKDRLGRALPQAPEIAVSTLGYRAAVLGAPSLFQ
jgi:glucokinase